MPWQVRVTGEAAEVKAGSTPSPLKKSEEPYWLEGRTNALQIAIHRRVKKHVVGRKQPTVESIAPVETPGSEASNTDTSEATVHVRATASGIAVAARSEGGDIVAPDGSTWKQMCVAPCTFKLDPGHREVMIEGFGTPTKRKLRLQPGGSAYLVAKPRSEILRTGAAILTLAGFTGILVGSGAMALTDLELKWTVVTVMSGVGALGLGFGLMFLSNSSLEVESAPKGASAPRAISVFGSF